MQYTRNIKMRDLEEISDLPEDVQTLELVARCYAVTVEQVRDMDVAEFKQCSQVVMERNGMDTGD